jgi:hypothetical protein
LFRSRFVPELADGVAISPSAGTFVEHVLLMSDEKRTNHDVMQRAAERPITGTGATSTIAASGGLDVPGREIHPTQDVTANSTREPFPGEREVDTLMPTTQGIMAGTGYGDEAPASDLTNTMDETTKREHAREGGGGNGGHRG